MPIRASILPIVLALVFASPGHAVCPLHLRFVPEPPSIVWDNVPGAKAYQVQESFDGFRTSRNSFPPSSPFPIQRRVSADTQAFYTVTAVLPSNVLSVGAAAEGCAEQIVVLLKADPVFRALTRKGVLPMVGSALGANGGRFRTALKLTATAYGEAGRLIFHPAGGEARPDDPFIRYSFDFAGQEMQFDDIVAAMGRSGIGSLDLVPFEGTPDSLPVAEARLYNDTPEGTVGTTIRPVLPYDFLQAPVMTVPVVPADGPFRVSVGLRTLTATRATALVYAVSGRLRDFRSLAWPADYTAFGPIAQMVGVNLAAGEFVTLFFDGAAIPFYTRTENRSNDPELFIAPGTTSTRVGGFVE